jgi:hypothetical protein
MTDVVHVAGQVISKPTSFQEAEKLAGILAKAREAAAVARESTPELLALLDAAIAAATGDEAKFKRAAAPGKIVGVGTYLALLLDAYPNSGSQNAANFGGFLVDDVMELAPPIAAVEIACRRWRQKSKFPPAISELLEEVRAAKAEIENALDFMAKLPAIRARTARELGVA